MTLQKNVVLKKIKAGVINDSLLRHEADLLKNLHHTYLPQVYDFLVIDGNVYTVIDYIQGYTMEDYITSGTVVDNATVKRWFEQLAQVLGYLHSQNPPIIHSDIKPANIIITPENNICLIDFNISLDGSADVVGFSSYYASPEQIQGAYAEASGLQGYTVDWRTDIYSMGATFYHLISMTYPAENPVETPLLESIMQDENPVYSIVDRCMAINPEERYGTAEQVLHALKTSYKRSKSYRRYNAVRFASVTLGVILICVGAWLCVYGESERKVENFNENYSEVVSLYKKQEYEQATEQGIKLINSSESKSYFKASPEYRSEIMHIISDSFFELEDYGNASDYGEKSLENSGDKLDEYYIEYVISLIRSGNTDKAEQAFEKAEKYGLSGVQIDVLQMEFMMSRGEYSQVLALFESKSTDESYKNSAECNSLCAEACEQLEMYDSQLSYRTKAYSLQPDNDNLRRLGEAYVNMANEYPAKEREYSLGAKQCFEQLTQGKYSIDTDYINLLHCYVNLGEINSASKLVTEMTEKYPDDYCVLAEGAQFSYDCGYPSQARQYAEKALSVLPSGELSDSEIYYKNEMSRILSE